MSFLLNVEGVTDRHTERTGPAAAKSSRAGPDVPTPTMATAETGIARPVVPAPPTAESRRNEPMVPAPPMAESTVADLLAAETAVATPSMKEPIDVNPLPAMVGRVGKGPAAAAQPVGDKAGESKPAVGELQMGKTASELSMQVEQAKTAQDSCAADIKKWQTLKWKQNWFLKFPLKEGKSLRARTISRIKKLM